MENQSSQESNPWCNLPTITSFDKGSSSCSTRCIEESKTKKNNKVRRKASSSILISSLINQLCVIIEKDPIQSKKLYFLLCDAMYNMDLIDPTYKLRAFELVQGRYIDAIYHLTSVARSIIGSENTVSIPRPFSTYKSLYQDHFRETGFIAVGGFGSVYKAVHKLDEVEYAIKKIIVKPGKIEKILNYLEEVKTLAKLNHTNIVSYKQAWIEPMSVPFSKQLPSANNLCSSDNIYESNLTCNMRNVTTEQESFSNKSLSDKKSNNNLNKSNRKCYSDEILYKSSIKTTESYSDIVSFRDGKESHNISVQSETSIIEINSRTSTEESVSSDDSFENQKICQYSSQKTDYTILYIQMALCEKTLRQWLDAREEPTPMPMITAIATQILNGLKYIHSLKIVHHDIKPSNIFISTSGKLQIQLGDFGLACPLQRETHDAIVGTCMYAAPEQLKGECNPKSDIYSVGIVFLEILILMKTSMECINMIESLKSGKVPTELAASYPKWVNTITQLVQKNPAERPSADELLEDLKMNEDITINKLKDENYKLKQENSLLLSENEKKDEIIRNQKEVIETLKAQLAQLKNC